MTVLANFVSTDFMCIQPFNCHITIDINHHKAGAWADSSTSGKGFSDDLAIVKVTSFCESLIIASVLAD